MQAAAIIENGHVIQDVLLDLVARLVAPPLHTFLFQAAEETLNDGVYPKGRLRALSIHLSGSCALDAMVV